MKMDSGNIYRLSSAVCEKLAKNAHNVHWAEGKGQRTATGSDRENREKTGG